MYKVHCLNNISKRGLELLTPEYELTDNLEEADVILVRSANMHDMEIPPSLKAVARAGAGVNNIPLEPLAAKGIPVFNTPGANANAVKELVICGMLLASRDVVGGIEWCRADVDDPDIGKSAEKVKKQFAGYEIYGKTLGVLGLGAIGRLVACAAEALGMKVVGYDPFFSVEQAAALSPTLELADDLNEVYGVADYLTIHVPATPETKGMLNANAFAAMKDGVVVLNFARDVLVDDAAMADALDSGKVACYVTDFVNPAVMTMKNAITIPHLGASTAEAEENCAIMAVTEVMDYLATGKKVHCVNMED